MRAGNVVEANSAAAAGSKPTYLDRDALRSACAAALLRCSWRARSEAAIASPASRTAFISSGPGDSPGVETGDLSGSAASASATGELPIPSATTTPTNTAFARPARSHSFPAFIVPPARPVWRLLNPLSTGIAKPTVGIKTLRGVGINPTGSTNPHRGGEWAEPSRSPTDRWPPLADCRQELVRDRQTPGAGMAANRS